MSASVSGRRGGQPSTTQPIAGPWLSPKVVTRNKCPNVLNDMANDLARGCHWVKCPRGCQRGSFSIAHVRTAGESVCIVRCCEIVPINQAMLRALFADVHSAFISLNKD